MRFRNGELEQAVRSVFLTKLAITVPANDVDLLAAGIVDSVTLVELVLALETQLGVSLPFESLEIDDFRTVQRIVTLVERSTVGGP